MLPVAFLLQDTGAIHGAQRATVDVLRALVRDGRVRPMVFLMREERMGETRPDYREAIAATGAKILPFAVVSAFSPRLARTVREHALARSIHILHTVGPKADVHGWMAASRDLRQVSTVHGWLFRPDPKERLHEWLNRRVLRRCHRVIALSRYYEDLLLRSGVDRARVVRIPSGFASEGMLPLPPTAGGVVGWMGRLSEEKQPALFLQAIALAAPRLPNARFLVAGEGGLKESLQALAVSLDIADRVEWSGYLPREEFFRRAGALVVTSRIENLPYAILEAMAYGRPVIATRVGGIPDLVDDGVTGHLVAPGDAQALADRLVDVAANPATAARLGAAGRVKLDREFSPAAMVEALVSVYQSAR